MIEKECRDLTHGEKIKGPDETIYIVHNNHRALGGGTIVATRTVIIPYKHCRDWRRVGKIKNLFACPGTYQVTIDKKID